MSQRVDKDSLEHFRIKNKQGKNKRTCKKEGLKGLWGKLQKD